MALSYNICVYILYDHPGFLSAIERGSPYRDFAEIVQKPHSHRAIFTISVQKSHNAPVMSMQAPYDYLKSLRSFDYLNSCGVLTISVRCPCAHRGIMRSTCDVSTGSRFFKICHSVELNKIVEVMMQVNLYDDDWVSLRWLNRKGVLDILLTS